MQNSFVFRRARRRDRSPASLAPIRRLGLQAMLVVVSAAAPAAAGEVGSGFAAGDVVVRGRLAGILTYDQKTTIDIVGGRIDRPPLVLPDVDVSLFLTDSISVTGQTGVLWSTIKIKQTLYGDIDVGTVWSVPLAVSGQYHLPAAWGIRPYIGAGIVANWFFGERAAGGFVEDFKVAPNTSPLVKIGFDYPINDRWFANLEVRQIFIPSQSFANQGFGAQSSMNTISVGLGLGYRF